MKREPDIADFAACGSSGGAAKRPRASDRVSAAATKLFYERGIRAVGVDEIVAEAGVTKPSLYRSYASKDALVCACLEARFAEIMAKVDAAEAEYPDDPLAAIRKMVVNSAAEMADPAYRGCPITNAAVEFPELDHPTGRVARDYKRRKHERMLQLISRLPTSNPKALADALILLFEGAYAIRHTCCTEGPSRSLAVAADAVIAGFLNARD